jgi:hypothetical protein
MDERLFLKVKVKSLAAEAKIIRKEEKRCKTASLREGLYRHRIDVVRRESRHANLAYGFLRGRKYHEMEPNAKEAPDWIKIRKMVEKYGSHYAPWSYNVEQTLTAYETRKADAKQHLVDVLKQFDEWIAQAKVTPTI